VKLNRIAPLISLASGIMTVAHAALAPVNVTNIPLANGVSAVAVSGKHLYTVGSGFQVFDISDPKNPMYEGGINIQGGGESLAVWGDYAYVTESAGTTGPLHILSIADPANPEEVGHIDGSWASVIASGGRAYLGGSDWSSLGTFIYDLSIPSSPAQLGHINASGPFDVCGQYLYFALPDLHIWDVSNPVLPIYVGHASAPTELAFAVAVQGSYAFVATGTNGMPTYNVSDPVHPAVAADPSCWTGSGIGISGNYVYAAWGSVFTAFDISNPTNTSAVFSGYSPFAAFGGVYPPRKLAFSRGSMYLPSYGGLSVWSLGIGSPPLSISTTLTNTVLLSWPTPTGAFSVEETTELNATAWIALTNMPVVNGSQNEVAIPAAAGTRLYRLALH
jgi:hypothetical protein